MVSGEFGAHVDRGPVPGEHAAGSVIGSETRIFSVGTACGWPPSGPSGSARGARDGTAGLDR